MNAGLRALSVWALALSAATGLPALADDWPQFRHDNRHTGVALDRLALPLTDVWTLPVSEAAFWHGRAFYVSELGRTAYLVCADSRTGGTIWQAPLYHQPGITPAVDLAPQIAVSESGVVFVSDWFTRSQAGFSAGPGRFSYAFGTAVNWFVRAFRAQDGRLLDEAPNPRFGVGTLSPATLVDGPLTALPDNSLLAPAPLYGGPFLVNGEEVAWSTLGCDYHRWSPGAAIDGCRVFHLIPLRDTPALGLMAVGYVPTQTGLGVLAGGQFEATQLGWLRKSTIGVLQGTNFAWHWDFPWTVSTAVSERSRVFLGTGGGRTLLALDAGSGAPVWCFPPNSLRPDEVGVGQSIQTVTPALPPINRGYPNAPQRPGSSAQPQPSVNGPITFTSRWPTAGSAMGLFRQPRLVVKDQRVFWASGAGIDCLDSESGLPLWPSDPSVRSRVPGFVVDLIGAGQYVVATTTRASRGVKHNELIALRPDSGKMVWRQEIPQEGTLAAADGLVFVKSFSLVALAPAERTFRLAVDSDRPDDYDENPAYPAIEDAGPASTAIEGANHGAEAAGVNETPRPQKKAPAPPTPKPGAAPPPGDAATHALADATVLRLTTELPETEMHRRIRERRRIHPELPLLITLDWLDARRDVPTFGARASWTDRDFAELQALCGRLAAEARPAHFDVAPDVNVYLARHPEQLAGVTRFLRGVRQEIAMRSPGTQLLASFNLELLRGVYGTGSDQPFGRLALPTEEKRSAALGLWELVDEIGLTSFPQSAFRQPAEMPGDYLFALKPLFGEKHVVITRVAARLENDTPEEQTRQASFLKHVFQAAYWLDATLIACPDAVSLTKPGLKTDVPDLALVNPAGERPSAAVWRDTLAWKRVQRLSAPAVAGPR